MSDSTLKNAKKILDQMNYGVDTARDWSRHNYDEYYLYFNNTNKELRINSILVFFAALFNWSRRSAFPFHQKQGKIMIENWRYFDLDQYLLSFLENYDAIKEELPAVHYIIMYNIRDIMSANVFINYLEPNNAYLEKELLRRLEGFETWKKYDYNDVLAEVGDIYI